MAQTHVEQEEALEGARLVRFVAKEDPDLAATLRQELEAQSSAVTHELVQQELQKDYVEEMLAELRKEARKRDRNKKLFIGLYLTLVGFMLVIAIVTHNPHLLNTLGSMTGMIAAGAAATQGQKKLTKSLAQYENDPRVVGPLAEALEFQDKELRKMVPEKLIRLLPQLKASDRNCLNDAQRACLYRALRGKNDALKLAILQSLQQIGDSKALPYVQKLAADQRAMSGPRMREAVALCLPFLTDLAEKEKNSQMLLRAADGNLTSSDVLLRPAEGGTVSEPEQLLRASSSDT